MRAAVICAFFDVLTAQERIRPGAGNALRSPSVTDITGKRVIAGKISPGRRDQSACGRSSGESELSQAQGDLRIARQKLSSLWGNATPRFERVDGAVVDLPDVPTMATLDQRVVASPSSRRTEAELPTPRSADPR